MDASPAVPSIFYIGIPYYITNDFIVSSFSTNDSTEEIPCTTEFRTLCSDFL